MQRNLSARVEVLTPVEDPELRQELRLILTMQLSDMRSAWDMQADGSYVQRLPVKDDEGLRGCQEQLVDAANKRRVAASKHKEKKVRNKLLSRFQKRLRESEH